MTLVKPLRLYNSMVGIIYRTIFSFSLLSLVLLLQVNYSGRLALAATDCLEGDGITANTTRKTAQFTDLAVDGTFDVFVTCGLPYEISLTADSNILHHILTTVKNGKMEITAARSICTKNPITINISLPSLKTVTTEGTCDIEVTKIKNDLFVVNADGTSTVRLQGVAQKLTLKAKGASTVMANELQASEVLVKTYDSATAVVQALKSLEAECHDASDLKYSGTPPSKKLQTYDVCDLIAL